MTMAAAYSDELWVRRDYARVPTIAIAVVLSLLLHLVLLVWTPTLTSRQDEPPVPPDPPPIIAYLQPAPAPPAKAKPPAVRPPPPTPAASAAPSAKEPPPVSKPAPKTELPPVIAIPKPTEAPPVVAAPTPPAPPQPEPPPVSVPPTVAVPPNMDFATFVKSRQAARGEMSPEERTALEADRANKGAVASAALKAPPPINFAPKKPTHSGGVFDIRRRGYDYAEFMFNGWSESFGRIHPQLVEVRMGANPNIDIAVIREMISIIRRYENGDFTWYSHKTGRGFTLSARARDNAHLEDFMMREFAEDLRRY